MRSTSSVRSTRLMRLLHVMHAAASAVAAASLSAFPDTPSPTKYLLKSGHDYLLVEWLFRLLLMLLRDDCSLTTVWTWWLWVGLRKLKRWNSS